MKILFLGSNPSVKSATLEPFWKNTNSMATLSKWIEQLPLNDKVELHFLNISNTPTEENRPLRVSEIKSNLSRLEEDIIRLQPERIVALGRSAERALTFLGTSHYCMPHPSGLNRKLNDGDFMQEKIMGLQTYIDNPIAFLSIK